MSLNSLRQSKAFKDKRYKIKMLQYILLSIGIVSLLSLSGVFFLSRRIERHLFFLVSFAIGALLGATFFDLLPETDQFGIVLLGILVFFVMEKLLFWHHHHHYDQKHKHNCNKVQPYAYLNLLGDGIHNFIDGMIIASSYLTSFPVGVSVTVAIVLHEIPQEIGDFGILLASGLSRGKALFYNFLSAVMSFAGGIIIYFFSRTAEGIAPTLLAFAAGGFLYIANVDLIPELHKERDLRKSFQQLLFILLGIGIIWLSTQYAHS